MALRWLSGGAMVDIADMHGVAECTFYVYLWETLDAIDRCLALGFPREDVAALSELEAGFAAFSGGVFKGCVGAVDGIVIKIVKPKLADCPNPRAYYCRKGFFAITVQAIVDSRCKFLWMSTDCAGSCHDATAFACSELARQLEAFGLPEGFYIVGDAAYALRDYMLTPFPGRNLGATEVWMALTSGRVTRVFELSVPLG